MRWGWIRGQDRGKYADPNAPHVHYSINVNLGGRPHPYPVRLAMPDKALPKAYFAAVSQPQCLGKWGISPKFGLPKRPQQLIATGRVRRR